MSKNYNQKYTKVEMDVILEKIKNCVVNNNYTISVNENRQENIDFINEYNIRVKKTKKYFVTTYS